MAPVRGLRRGLPGTLALVALTWVAGFLIASASAQNEAAGSVDRAAVTPATTSSTELSADQKNAIQELRNTIDRNARPVLTTHVGMSFEQDVVPFLVHQYRHTVNDYLSQAVWTRRQGPETRGPDASARLVQDLTGNWSVWATEVVASDTLQRATPLVVEAIVDFLQARFEATATKALLEYQADKDSRGPVKVTLSSARESFRRYALSSKRRMQRVMNTLKTKYHIEGHLDEIPVLVCREADHLQDALNPILEALKTVVTEGITKIFSQIPSALKHPEGMRATVSHINHFKLEKSFGAHSETQVTLPPNAPYKGRVVQDVASAVRLASDKLIKAILEGVATTECHAHRSSDPPPRATTRVPTTAGARVEYWGQRLRGLLKNIGI